MVLIQINKQEKQPIFQQIFLQLKEMIEKGTLIPGENLPSTRKMADYLEVHRTTVCRAYDELWAAGYLESTSGGYSRVRKRNKLVNKNITSSESIIDWETQFSDAAKLLNPYTRIGKISDKDLIDFRRLSPDTNLLPVENFRHCLNHVLLQNGNELLDYGNSFGYEPLRAYLAKQMSQHGISTTTNEIILTNGIQQGLALVLNLLCNPGDSIITESPCYTKGLWLMKFLKINVIDVAMTNSGMDLEALEEKLKTHNPKAIYTIPTFHNPMGISSSQAHRENLLALCEKYKVPLIEDGFEEEMKYFGKAVLPIKSMDKKQLVIYLGTFSKILFPGLRIGWIVAPKSVISKLAALKQTTELSGNSVTQAAVYEFCQKGFYELHKKRLHRVYRKRMQAALQACREFLPTEFIHYTKPEGGYLFWFSLTNLKITEGELMEKLMKAGVAVSPGSHFFTTPPLETHFRLCIAHRNESEIREGIKRIGMVVNALNQ